MELPLKKPIKCPRNGSEIDQVAVRLVLLPVVRIYYCLNGELNRQLSEIQANEPKRLVCGHGCLIC